MQNVLALKLGRLNTRLPAHKAVIPNEIITDQNLNSLSSQITTSLHNELHISLNVSTSPCFPPQLLVLLKTQVGSIWFSGWR